MTKFAVHRNPNLGDFVAVCLQLPADEREQFEAFTGNPYDPGQVAAAFSLRAGPSWVITADEIPIVVAGFDLIRPGVWQDWLFSTPQAWDAQHWRSVTKICRKAMDALLRGDAHRLQCVSLASRIHAHRWYRPLGLELEGTLRGYGVNGEDALMFSRLRIPDNG
jgi:hypothetical protein